jgi:myosin heavy chain 6/7
LVEADPKLYFFIAQGMTVIDNVDDAEEMKMTDEAFDILNFKPVIYDFLNLLFIFKF